MTQEADTKPGPYYVSMRDGDRTALLAGPFATHREALDLNATGRPALEADNVMPGAWFFSFGTVRMTERCTAPGKLNDRLGVVPTYGKEHA